MRWQDLIAACRLLIGAEDPNATPTPYHLRRAVSHESSRIWSGVGEGRGMG